MDKKDFTPDLINFLHEASSKYDVSPYQIVGKRRTARIVKARNYAVHKILLNTEISLTDCGKFLNRTPATILHAFNSRII